MSSPSSSRPRQPRDRRRAGVAVRLLDRDQALLRALARFRLARTGDLTRLFFHGVRPDTAAVRLRRLFDAGYLDVVASELHQPNHYRLGARGRSWIQQAGLVAGRAPVGGQAHHLAIVALWTELAWLSGRSVGFRLALFRPDWELRELGRRGRELVVPDALAELVPTGAGLPEVVLRLALEVDLGTESIRTLARKIDGYRVVLGDEEGLFGWTDVTLVLVAGQLTAGRRQSLEHLLEQRSPVAWEIWPLGDPLMPLLQPLFRRDSHLPLQPPLAVRGGARG